MILVNIRCGNCWSVLHRVGGRPGPADDSTILVRRCRRCDMPNPPRVADVMIRKGIDGFPMLAAVPWQSLQESIERAERTGKTQDFPVRVVGPSGGDGTPDVVPS